MKKFIFVVLSILLIISCTSVNGLMQPDWVTRTPKIVGSVAYVGSGTAKDEMEAKDLAYQDILARFGEDLGYEISSQYFRELIGTDQIKTLSLSVTEHYMTQSSDGMYTYYAFAKTPQSTLSSSRSPEYIALLEREKMIESKLSEAFESYKNNNDIAAIDKVLEATLISLEGDVKNPEYTPETLMQRAESYARNIRLTLSKSKKGNAGVTLKVKRAKGLFYPPVVDARINATYSMMNANGDVIKSSFECNTNEKGAFVYTNTNPYILRNGEIEFSISVDLDLLQKIEEKTSVEFTSEIKAIIKEKSVSYSYNIKSNVNSSNAMICYSLSDEDGNAVHVDGFESSLVDYLSKAGLEIGLIEEFQGEEAVDIFEQASKEYGEYDYFIVIRSGIAGYIVTEKEVAARADGRVSFFKRGGEEEFLIQDSFMVGYGQDETEAGVNALENEARIIAGRLLQVL